jgi:hypothetical protein
MDIQNCIQNGSGSNKGYKLLNITKSTNKEKKLMAIFKYVGKNGKKDHLKIVHFGAAGMSDYTKHKDPERKQRYIIRHRKNENWNDPITPGSLSRYVLWNKPSLKESIKDYKKRFNL